MTNMHKATEEAKSRHKQIITATVKVTPAKPKEPHIPAWKIALGSLIVSVSIPAIFIAIAWLLSLVIN